MAPVVDKGLGKAAEVLKKLGKTGELVENVGDAGQAIGPINNVPTPATKKLVVDKNPVGHPTPAAVPQGELTQLRDTNIYRDADGKIFVKQVDGTLVPATPEDVANAGKQMQAASKTEEGYVEAQGMAGTFGPARTTIAFAQGTAQTAVQNIGRVDHAARHLIDAGVLNGNSGSKAVREAFRTEAIRILENPTHTFDHAMSQGGQAVRGFVGEINGKKVVIFVAKEPRGKIQAGEVVTSIVPSSKQSSNWGF